MPDEKAENSQAAEWKFEGFLKPESNFFKMPNVWTDITAKINSLAELKVVEYVLRHTWGYQEYDIKKRITTDEFMHGRKRQDGSRMDLGTGLSNRSVIDGLRRAVAHGLLIEEVDDRDKARIKKFYSLNMMLDADTIGVKNLHSGDNPDMKNLHSGEKNLHSGGEELSERTEKDTLERNNRNRVVVQLREHGIERATAVKLAGEYAPQHLVEKIEYLEANLELASRGKGKPITDPAGWLITAIEKDFKPPLTFITKKQQEAETIHHSQEWEAERLQEAAEKRALRNQVISWYHIPDELLNAWQKALEVLKQDFAKPYFDTWLQDTFLLSVEKGVATIGAGSLEGQQWLTNRARSLVSHALTGILDTPVEATFAVVELPDLS